MKKFVVTIDICGKKIDIIVECANSYMVSSKIKDLLIVHRVKQIPYEDNLPEN
jgi:hypothetical protein